MRVSAFIDGFNLYHALDSTGKHHLKWLDLRALCLAFAPAPQDRRWPSLRRPSPPLKSAPRRHGEHGGRTEYGKDLVGVLLTLSCSPCALRVLRVSVVRFWGVGRDGHLPPDADASSRRPVAP
jgi:hypothetical protein